MEITNKEDPCLGPDLLGRMLVTLPLKLCDAEGRFRIQLPGMLKVICGSDVDHRLLKRAHTKGFERLPRVQVPPPEIETVKRIFIDSF